jgi:hypothetical protein
LETAWFGTSKKNVKINTVGGEEREIDKAGANGSEKGIERMKKKGRK